MIEPALTITTRDEVLADERGRQQAVYAIVADLFGLQEWPVNEGWGRPILAFGSDVEISVERHGPDGSPNVVTVQAPITIALSGERATRFVAAMQQALATR